MFGADHRELEGLVEVALARDQPAEALALLERATAIFDALEGVQDYKSETRFFLARSIVRAGGERTRALVEARKASDEFCALGSGKASELAEVEAFGMEIAERGPSPLADMVSSRDVPPVRSPEFNWTLAPECIVGATRSRLRPRGRQDESGWPAVTACRSASS